MNDVFSHLNETRTATPGMRTSTVQAWKKKAAPLQEAAAPEVARQGIAARLSQAAEPRTQSAPVSSFQQALTEAPAPAAVPEDSFSFNDFLDVINPLQHLPVVGMVYRGLTGDTIGSVAQIIGGGIYGGPVGAALGTANAVMQETTGHDIAGNILSLVSRRGI